MWFVIGLVLAIAAGIGALRGVVEGAWGGWRVGVRAGFKMAGDVVVSLAVMLGLFVMLRWAGIFKGN